MRDLINEQKREMHDYTTVCRDKYVRYQVIILEMNINVQRESTRIVSRGLTIRRLHLLMQLSGSRRS